MASPPPQLPQGPITLIGTLSDNFAFHASPESFIASRILALHTQNPTLSQPPGILRAKILNRNVAVVSSAPIVRAILGDDGYEDEQVFIEREEVPGESFTAGKAYDELMKPFFPPPNLLLMDVPGHAGVKERWMGRMREGLPGGFLGEGGESGGKAKTIALVKKVVREHFGEVASGETVDLYGNMKDLSWRLLLGIFLSMEKGSEEYLEFEGLQEDLLRGQFSLFPMSVNAGFWKSPRSRGLDARRKIEALLAVRMKGENHGCPFAIENDAERADVASHMLLFTSSLAAKAIASLLTAYLLNVYVHRRKPDAQTVIESWHEMQDMFPGSKLNADGLLSSALTETGRLSPPVVGVMRRAEKNVVLKTTEGQPDTLIPKGWDVWLYFAAAGRDPEMYAIPNQFWSDRYLVKYTDEREGFEFGWGPKSCLGGPFVQKIVRTVVDACMEMDLKIEADSLEKGVRGWLGWEDASPEDWARDMKQLPTQRPQRPVNVRISYSTTK
jgi:hypothetical protein